ncbi:MerR-like DNA binding protein [Nocardiopsis sp. Huas11]|uniref:MerR family transcriptional regulator n=1 Tax=Nocardiopsis sp. Huas11 TaxID=2183912 RepID=UPI000EAEE2CF|nr:MerR family transcriptional regulator [Nocardiopsis sp. Huas11]RKS08688.1 MerR-like DNA binding protein [Nocardiopsis sp. Huas11]
MSTGLRSGQVAEAAGVNVQTLRYYERRGLLAKPQRSNGGHRLYDEDTVVALRVIKAAQRLGFTLACCALPVLIAAGAVGAGAGVVVGWLSALAVALGVLAAGTWWLSRRPRSCSCAPKVAGQGGCGCGAPG